MALPSSRQILTSLINAIADIPLLHYQHTATIKSSSDDDDDAEDADSRIAAVMNIKREQKLRKRNRRRLLLLESEETETNNALKLVPASHRHLIVTLHVLFPEVVLPALDLLDRGLVRRVVLLPPAGSEDGDGRRRFKTKMEKGKVVKRDGVDIKMEDEDHRGGLVEKEQAAAVRTPKEEQQDYHSSSESDDDDDDDDDDNDKKKYPQETDTSSPPPAFYLVRSAQPVKRYGQRTEDSHPLGLAGGGGQKAYIVRLDAWNCTCAAFAFAAFPLDDDDEDGEEEDDREKNKEGKGERRPTTTGVTTSCSATVVKKNDNSMDMDSADTKKEDKERPHEERDKWFFGGMTLDNRSSSSSTPPLCKHLLACLLAERWSSALGRYVVEHKVGREEMAGIAAEV